MSNLSVYDKADFGPFQEEVLTAKQKDSLISLEEQIVTDVDPPSSVDAALALLNDKLGSTLKSEIPNILDTVSS